MEKNMFVNKIGYDHLSIGMNCQDYGFELPDYKVKVVADGCSEGLHSEVGAKTFCHLLSKGYDIEQAFSSLVAVYGQTIEDMKNFLCFTYLSVTESNEYFITSNCGDGFLILEDNEGNISFVELTDGEYPKYYIYNYIDKKYLSRYVDGVSVENKLFSKEEYKNVGIASDGLRFIVNADEDIKQEFIECLKSGKAVKIKRFINRNQKLFRDDITIVF